MPNIIKISNLNVYKLEVTQYSTCNKSYTQRNAITRASQCIAAE